MLRLIIKFITLLTLHKSHLTIDLDWTWKSTQTFDQTLP